MWLRKRVKGKFVYSVYVSQCWLEVVMTVWSCPSPLSHSHACACSPTCTCLEYLFPYTIEWMHYIHHRTLFRFESGSVSLLAIQLPDLIAWTRIALTAHCCDSVNFCGILATKCNTMFNFLNWLYSFKCHYTCDFCCVFSLGGTFLNQAVGCCACKCNCSHRMHKANSGKLLSRSRSHVNPSLEIQTKKEGNKVALIFPYLFPLPQALGRDKIDLHSQLQVAKVPFSWFDAQLIQFSGSMCVRCSCFTQGHLNETSHFITQCSVTQN